MPVKDPALAGFDSVPETGRKRWRTWQVAVLNTMMGWADAMSRTAAGLVRLFGFRAIALARTGEPSSTILPAGVRVWLSDATIDPSFCGPTVRLGSPACGV